jgi:hypothetical protein
MSFQWHYPYQEISKCLESKLINDSISAKRYLQRIFQPCLYKEQKTWRKIESLQISNWDIYAQLNNHLKKLRINVEWTHYAKISLNKKDSVK